ncbi:hypothetical protein EV644_14524 [Kribbella orskensis]|uniref:Secreted protein n=2 Tax=Kribbellaceae TaxID=2726069 RepID=A0ABY2B680_9ACTN|nr:hypothetical protein EV642_14824 [Kribbella sp. VKM Ac-2500]TCO08558.1 hypothetical protein EV644_14524 [Kribbella orskensis]
MRQLLQTKVVVPLVIVLVAVTLTVSLALRWHADPGGSQPGGARSTDVAADENGSDEAEAGDDGATKLDAWQRPTTSDPKAFAIAYARAIWTYDTSIHSFWDWRDAVSVFADPTDPPEGPRVARSLLPYPEQFEQLQLHDAKASVSDLTADVTSELKAMEKDPRAPTGWHGYLVRGAQTTVMDDRTSTAPREATVAVVCDPDCRFWSASNESPQ